MFAGIVICGITGITNRYFTIFYAILYFVFPSSHCEGYYLWQHILARGLTRQTQIPAHHDGDVASTHLASRLVETVLLSADLNFFWIRDQSIGFLRFKPFVVRLSQNLGGDNKTCIGHLVIVVGRGKAGQRMDEFVVLQIFRFVDHDVTARLGRSSPGCGNS